MGFVFFARACFQTAPSDLAPENLAVNCQLSTVNCLRDRTFNLVHRHN
ncbi:MAG: hypothetical protein HC849_10915 [Oscillatoriales cyanobacterium RU_3_3]|nr:hypothetical protein [Oscillatoriales cyanobacterium RU_3_3]NJR24612.1 hypothetical protein [Richelia sp. CSU_2_1]